MTFIEKLRKAVKQEREKLNMSQEELAEKLEVNSRHISAFETGKTNMSFDLIQKLFDILDLKLEDNIKVDNKITQSNIKRNLKRQIDMIDDDNFEQLKSLYHIITSLK